MSEDKVKQLLAESNFVRIGDIAPNFDQTSTKGDISWHKFIDNSWSILFSHPKSNTPICSTELAAINKHKDDFQRLGVKVAAIAVDSLEDNINWVKDIAKHSNSEDLWFPILCDEDYKVAKLYGMVNQEHINAAGLPLTLRSVFFISPDKKVSAIITYPANLGRSIPEILRVIEGLQLTTKYAAEGKPVACPVNWKAGDRIVVPPFVSTEKAKELYTNLEIVESYLRYADDPSITQ